MQADSEQKSADTFAHVHQKCLTQNVSKKAFTLIELLAVIVIVGVLAALTFPLVLQVRMAAWRATSTSNLRQLHIANVIYAQDNKHYCPSGSWPSNDTRWCGQRTSSSQPWNPTKGLLSPYFGKSNKVNACPLLLWTLETQDDSINVASFEAAGGGYGYNDYIGGAFFGEVTMLTKSYGLYIGIRPDEIANPARTVMFTTTALAKGAQGGKIQGVQEYPFSHPPFFAEVSGGGRPSPSTHFRFNGKALVVWCDGHVSAEKLDKRDVGENPYDGDANAVQLGWFGPDDHNGYWNPNYSEW